MSDTPPYDPRNLELEQGKRRQLCRTNRPIAGPTHDKELPVGRIRCNSILWRHPTASRSP